MINIYVSRKGARVRLKQKQVWLGQERGGELEISRLSKRL